MLHRNHHSRPRRRRKWRRRHDRCWRHHDRCRCHNRRCRRHNRRCRRHNRRCRRHNRRAVVRIPIGIIPDLPIPATPVMWMRCGTTSPAVHIRRRHTATKCMMRRRSAMRPRTMPCATMVSRMHRTRSRMVRGMAGRNSPSGTGNEAASNGKNDRSFHSGFPFCFSSEKHKRVQALCTTSCLNGILMSFVSNAFLTAS